MNKRLSATCLNAILAFSSTFSNYAKERVLNITRKVNAYAIPLACDTEKLKPINGKKENLVITVCYVDESNIKRKGLKTFVENVKFLPQLGFALISSHTDNSINYLKEISSPNVEFTGFVPNEELFTWLSKGESLLSTFIRRRI